MSGQLGDPAPPTTASPKKLPPAPAPSSTPTAVDSKHVVEPADPPPPAPEAKVVPLVPEPDGVSSVSDPLPDSQINVQSEEQTEPLADENVSEVVQSRSETQEPPLPVEGEAGNQSGLDTAAPTEVETEPQITQSEASPAEKPKEEHGPEKVPDMVEEPPVLTSDAVLQEVPPEIEQTSPKDSNVPTDEVLERTEVEQGDQSVKTQVEQVEPEPVMDGAGLRDVPPPPPCPSPPPQGEIAEVVESVASRSDEAQQDPTPDSGKEEPQKILLSEEPQKILLPEEPQKILLSEEPQKILFSEEPQKILLSEEPTSESKPLVSEGEVQEPKLPEPPEEVKDLREAPEQNSEENKVSEKVSTEEETVELQIAQRADEEMSGEIKATETTAEEKTVEEKVYEDQKEEGNKNEPSQGPEEQRFCNNDAASEPLNEVKADEGKGLEEEGTEEKEPTDQKGPEEKVNGAESSQDSPSDDTENICQEEKDKREVEIPKDETQKMIRTETETDGDKHQNRNTEESAQMVPDVIKGEEMLIRDGSETCSKHTKCDATSQKETEEERNETGAREKALIKDEEGNEGAAQIQETVSDAQKSAGSNQGDMATPGCLKEKLEGETTERNLEDGGVAAAVVSVAEAQVLPHVADEKESQEENVNSEETNRAEDQPLGKASDGEVVAEVTVAFSKETRGCDGLCASSQSVKKKLL